MLPRRLRRLPSHVTADGLVVLTARGFRARLLGLAFLRALPPGHALLIPRCRSVHTFGMRFALDLVWLGARGEVIRVQEAVPPWRFAHSPGADAVLELRAGEAAELIPIAAAGSPPAPRPPRDP